MCLHGNMRPRKGGFYVELFLEWLVPDVTKFPRATQENTTTHLEPREDSREEE